MIFKVERLGPVNRAEIDLSKDLILLTGPNGTGKTYVAWAVYGLLRTWQGPYFIDILGDVLRPLADQLLADRASELDLDAIVLTHGSELMGRVSREYTQRIAGDFAADEQLFKTTELHFDAGDHAWDMDLVVGGGSPSYHDGRLYSRKQLDSTMVSVDVATETFQGPLGQLPLEQHASVREKLSSLLVFWVLQTRRHLRPIIFPTERIATTIFARELASHRTELVAEMFGAVPQGVADLLTRSAQRYPRPIQDSLQMAVNLEDWSRQTSAFAPLADDLETHFLRGKVQLSQYGQLTFVPDQRSDVSLGMHITASVVKSLSLLVFYLRHMAQKGDFVVIDEPELNLHPDNQRLIARVLARAVNRGLKVMASTHSDYLVRELNNLIMLGQDTEPIKALRQKHGYEEAELLKPSQLGVYLFHDNTAEDVPVDETGFSIATIDAEIDRLNAVSQEIYATLFEQDPE